MAGKLSAQEIADSHGITRDMVYSLKHAAKKNHIIADPVQRLDDLHQPAEHDPHIANRVYQLGCRFRDGTIDAMDFYQQVQKLIGV